MKLAPALPRGVDTLEEQGDGSGLHVHAGWAAEFPWIAQGITGTSADMSLFGGSRTGDVIPRWQQLRDRLLCSSIVHSRQIHGGTVLVHGEMPAGVLVARDADGHVTREQGVLLAVSVADCVPISIVAPDIRAIGLLHAGWRGAAAGILEAGISGLRDLGAAVSTLHVHFGPAICGACFEVGPEVPAGVGITETGVTHVDLRARLAERAMAIGVRPDRITVSAFCTRHGDSPFYSHRGGCAERQIAVLGMRTV